MNKFKSLKPEALQEIHPIKSVIVDVRTKMEHLDRRLAQKHAHEPLDTLNPKSFMMRHGFELDSPIYVLCRNGNRAKQAAEKFLAEGFSNIHVVEGGLVACEQQGHELKGHSVSGTLPETSKTTLISLERQVRIFAGTMTFVGAILAYALSPAFIIIPIAIGAGLLFAGVTDKCAAALILTKAPWNRVYGAQSCSSGPAGAKVGQSCQ